MSKGYILAVDQSTSGTKALLFDDRGEIIIRKDLPHEQKISPEGYVSHDPMEIYCNVLKTVKMAVEESGISKGEIKALAISNQRETALAWDKITGNPLCDAVVWQCARGEEICQRLKGNEELIESKTGLRLSPYFSAAKIAWVLENFGASPYENVCGGTIDSWLVYKLTLGKSFKTDYSNASRTELFNINELKWDEEICKLFGIPVSVLPEVVSSNSLFGYTSFEGYFENEIPIYGVMGDSHGALYGQGCHKKGMVKATYGTGSSIMMNVGDKRVYGKDGLVSSIAYGINGKVNYVLEGNINYTGSTIKWLVDEVGLISSSKEAGELALLADENDNTYLVPAFTGLGAPYFDSNAKCILCGMSRTTGKSEIVKAAENSIAYQINDIVSLMKDSGIEITELRVDGGPTRDKYLMQFQSDISDVEVIIPKAEELSAIGVAYAAGISAGIYDESIFIREPKGKFSSTMKEDKRQTLLNGWKKAIQKAME